MKARAVYCNEKSESTTVTTVVPGTTLSSAEIDYYVYVNDTCDRVYVDFDLENYDPVKNSLSFCLGNKETMCSEEWFHSIDPEPFYIQYPVNNGEEILTIENTELHFSLATCGKHENIKSTPLLDSKNTYASETLYDCGDGVYALHVSIPEMNAAKEYHYCIRTEATEPECLVEKETSESEATFNVERDQILDEYLDIEVQFKACDSASNMKVFNDWISRVDDNPRQEICDDIQPSPSPSSSSRPSSPTSSSSASSTTISSSASSSSSTASSPSPSSSSSSSMSSTTISSSSASSTIMSSSASLSSSRENSQSSTESNSDGSQANKGENSQSIANNMCHVDWVLWIGSFVTGFLILI
eukprot:gb/GECH01008479.1/.p1 GENE.gb/GECH01008479.1/~~gb/GECH01008479.1/.p1  ORF type:complete len:357 (+),score=98.08 gb/GECH01008479.1/:1-1071(+)